MFSYNRSEFTEEELAYITCQTPKYPKIIKWRNILKYVVIFAIFVYMGYMTANGITVLQKLNTEFYGDPYEKFLDPDTVSHVIGQHIIDDTVTLSDVIIDNDYLSRGLAVLLASTIFAIGCLLIFVFGAYHLLTNLNDNYIKELDKIRMELHTGIAELVNDE